MLERSAQRQWHIEFCWILFLSYLCSTRRGSLYSVGRARLRQCVLRTALTNTRAPFRFSLLSVGLNDSFWYSNCSLCNRFRLLQLVVFSARSSQRTAERQHSRTAVNECELSERKRNTQSSYFVFSLYILVRLCCLPVQSNCEWTTFFFFLFFCIFASCESKENRQERNR